MEREMEEPTLDEVGEPTTVITPPEAKGFAVLVIVAVPVARPT